jgi:hypothetical protein
MARRTPNQTKKTNKLYNLFNPPSLLKNDDYFKRYIAAESLGQLNQKAQTVLPDMVQWIEAQPDDVQSQKS